MTDGYGDVTLYGAPEGRTREQRAVDRILARRRSRRDDLVASFCTSTPDDTVVLRFDRLLTTATGPMEAREREQDCTGCGATANACQTEFAWHCCAACRSIRSHTHLGVTVAPRGTGRADAPTGPTPEERDR